MAVDLQVLVGATVPERDITEVIDGLGYSSANPGGFASCNFTVPGRAMYRFVNELRAGNRIWVRRGAKTLWEGFIVSDPEAVKFGESEDVAVECGGLLEVAKRRKDYCRTWYDFDYDQWQLQSNSSSNFSGDADGQLYLSIAEGTAAVAGSGIRYWYWIDSGLGDVDIVAIFFDAEWVIGALFDAKVSYSTSPYGSWTDANFLASAETSPVADFRCPASGSFPAGTRAVRFSYYCTAAATAGADRHITVTDLQVSTSTAGSLDVVMAEVADDIAATTTTTTIAYTGSMVVRPFSTRAEALDYLASLHSLPVDWGFWESDSFSVAERATAPALVDHLIVDASAARAAWDVERIGEDACDEVCVLYGILDDATYPDGTVRPLWVTTSAYGTARIGLDTAHVHVLDYSAEMMTAATALNRARQYLVYSAVTQYEGSVPVTGSCKRVDGVPVAACEIRAGQWVENLDEFGHGPRFVSHADYDRDSDTATLTIGDPRKEFAAVPRPAYVPPLFIAKKGR